MFFLLTKAELTLRPANDRSDPLGSTIDRKVGIVASGFFPLSGGMEKQAMLLAEELTKRGRLSWVATPLIQNARSNEKLHGFQVHRLGRTHLFFHQALKVFKKEVRLSNMTWYEEEQMEKANAKRRCIRSLKAFVYDSLISVEILGLLILRRKKVDVIVCFSMTSFDALFILISRYLGIKSVARASSSGLYLFNGLDSRFLYKQARKAHAYAAVSTAIESELEKVGIDRGRIYPVPNAVDVPDFKWEACEKKIYDATFVGNFSQQPLKGIDVLVRAWRDVSAESQGPILNLCAGGEDHRIRQLVRQLGLLENVVFSGAVGDTKVHLLKSRIFVLPSRVEGLSNALLEAMALGMPCVATRISGNTDVITNNVNGLLVRPDDHRQLASAIQYLLSAPDEAARLACEARKTIMEKYTREITLKKYIELIDKL